MVTDDDFDMLDAESKAVQFNNRKRLLEKSVSSQAAKKNSSDKHKNHPYGDFTLKISLIGTKSNFAVINWIKVYEFLNTVSTEWDFVAFTSDHSQVIIDCFDEENSKKILSIKEILIGQEAYAVKIEKLKSLGKKGIIYNKILATLDEEQIKDILIENNVNNYVRLQKFDLNGVKKSYTGSIIVHFNDQIPKYIKVGNIQIQINNLTPRPMICYHCGLLGHTRARCLKLSIVFCETCYYPHSEGEECIIKCKQCSGLHFSTDTSCEALIREVQILKIKESHGLTYFDAKEVSQKLNKAPVIDPIVSAELKIQYLLNRNKSLIETGKRQLIEKQELEIKYQECQEKVEILEEQISINKTKFDKQLDSVRFALEQLQTNYEKELKDSKIQIEEIKNIRGNLSAANEKIKIHEGTIAQLTLEKNGDEKQIEEFINSQDGIVKAFVSFVNNKKKAKDYKISLKIKPKRSNSLERLPNF